jgi:hypothetical protein
MFGTAEFNQSLATWLCCCRILMSWLLLLLLLLLLQQPQQQLLVHDPAVEATTIRLAVDMTP